MINDSWEDDEDDVNFSVTTENVLGYIAGYIGKKIYRSTLSCTKVQTNLWIHMKSDGELVHPTDELVENCKEMEKLFLKFHGKTRIECRL